MEESLVSVRGDSPARQSPSPEKNQSTDSAVWQGTRCQSEVLPPTDDSWPNSGHIACRGSPTAAVTVQCQNISNPKQTEVTADQTDSQQSARAKLQEAIDKVQLLDCNLEKRLKEHMEAKVVTADLRALVRRELAELDGSHSGRHVTQEETDNTRQFMKVLEDNNDYSDSETSSGVTPIFQTQLRSDCGGTGGADPGPQQAADEPASPAAEDPSPPPSPPLPPPPAHPQHEQNFIRKNIELAKETGGSLAMTEWERCRLEQLLVEDNDQLENAFSIDQHHHQLLNSLDDQISSLGASVTAPAGSSLFSSHPPAGGGADGGVGGESDDDPPVEGVGGSELNYLEATRQERETATHLEMLHRRLEQLAAVEVCPLNHADMANVIQGTIASLASAPCITAQRVGEHSEIGDQSVGSTVSVRAQMPVPSGTCSEADSGGNSPRQASEAPTEATLDARSVLSAARRQENERQLAAELPPDSPTAWLVDVSRGQQRLQLVVPRLSRQLISSLLDNSRMLARAPEQQCASVAASPEPGTDRQLTGRSDLRLTSPTPTLAG